MDINTFGLFLTMLFFYTYNYIFSVSFFYLIFRVYVKIRLGMYSDWYEMINIFSILSCVKYYTCYARSLIPFIIISYIIIIHSYHQNDTIAMVHAMVIFNRCVLNRGLNQSPDRSVVILFNITFYISFTVGHYYKNTDMPLQY